MTRKVLLLPLRPQQGREESLGKGGRVPVRAQEAGLGAQRENKRHRAMAGKEETHRGRVETERRDGGSERDRERGRGGRERDKVRE